jgi:hypothetical protein
MPINQPQQPQQNVETQPETQWNRPAGLPAGRGEALTQYLKNMAPNQGGQSGFNSLASNKQLQEQQPMGKRQAGTGFTNIGRILQANVGAGQQMGQQIGASMGAQAGMVKAGAEQSAKQFKQQTEEAKNKALADIRNAGQYANVGVGQLPGTLSGMTDKEASDYYEKMKNASYSGGMGMGNINQLQAQAGGLIGMGKAGMGGQLGQRELLRSMVAQGGPYSRGQSILDATLLGQNRAAQQAIQAGTQQALQAGQDVGSKIAEAGQIGQQAKSEVELQKQKTTQGLLSSLQNIKSEAEKQATDVTGEGARLKDILSQYAADEKNVVLSDADKEILGNIEKFGIDPNLLVMTNDEAVNKQILNNIINSANLSGAGKYKYTDEQQRAAKNLALMTGQTDVAKGIEESKFNQNIFSGANSAIKSTTKQPTDVRNQLIKDLNLDPNVSSTQIGQTLNDAGMTLAAKDKTSNDYLSNYKSGSTNTDDNIKAFLNVDEFLKKATAHLGRDEVYNIMRDRFHNGKDIHGLTPYAVGQLKNAVEDRMKQRYSKLNDLYNRQSSTTSLQDYIKKIAGLK